MELKPPIQLSIEGLPEHGLSAEKINEKMKKNISSETIENPTAIAPLLQPVSVLFQWIEKLLQIPIANHRKYAIWRILIPYLFNIKNLSDNRCY